MQLVPGLQTPQYAHGVLGTRLADVDLLKPALERLLATNDKESCTGGGDDEKGNEPE